MLSLLTSRRSRSSLLALALLIPFFAGCGTGKGKAVVKGTVTYNGKLLKIGTVSFLTADNRVGSSQINSSGQYTVSDAPIGDAKICVTMPTAPHMSSKAPPGVGTNPPPDMMPKDMAPAGDPRDIVPLPEKYATVEKTDLKYTVPPGESTHNITLTP